MNVNYQLFVVSFCFLILNKYLCCFINDQSLLENDKHLKVVCCPLKRLQMNELLLVCISKCDVIYDVKGLNSCESWKLDKV